MLIMKYKPTPSSLQENLCLQDMGQKQQCSLWHLLPALLTAGVYAEAVLLQDASLYQGNLGYTFLLPTMPSQFSPGTPH